MEVQIISKTPLTISEVKETLDDLEKKGELSGSQQKIKDFATRFNKLDKASATKLVKELRSADIPRMTEEAAVEIEDLFREARRILGGNNRESPFDWLRCCVMG